MSSKLVWILAGGAVLALGGAAIWLWRKRSKSAKRNGEQPPPEPSDVPLSETENTSPPRATTQTSAAPDAQPKATKAAFLAGDQFGLFTSTSSTPADATPRAPEAAAVVATENSEPAAEDEASAEPTMPAVLIPKRRRKRYPVGPGDLIELHPDRITGNTTWSASRPDVEVRVIEQDASRALVALDGPAGEVNVALLCAGPKGPRPITSWKFEIVDKAA